MSDQFEGFPAVSGNGVHLACREAGTGAPLILIHGSASDIRTWDRQLAPLAASRRVVAYSRRYARPNADIPEGADDQMLPHVADLVALMDARDIAAADLVGHS